jgi:large subunit ribosomal protein L32
MPLPKRRHSKTRGRKRRTHYKMVAPTRSLCPQCREIKPPHHICPHCGFYKGREVISVEGE